MSLEKNIIKWFTTERVGLSSRCMAAHLTGNKCDGSYPRDGGDFGRCEGLLNAVPELRPLLPKMAEVNEYWAALIPEWDNIKVSPNQYKAIRAILDSVEIETQRGV